MGCDNRRELLQILGQNLPLIEVVIQFLLNVWNSSRINEHRTVTFGRIVLSSDLSLENSPFLLVLSLEMSRPTSPATVDLG